MKRIALLDNMNNMMFAIARYLNDRGYEVELFLYSDTYSHFMPSCDSLGEISFPVHFVGKSNKIWLSKDLSKLFAQFDIIIGCGYAPYLLNKIGRALDIFVPHGSDFFYYPFSPLGKHPRTWYLKFKGWLQKKAIEKVRYVHMDFTNPELENVWKKYTLLGQRLQMPVPFIYLPQFDNKELSDKYRVTSPIYNQIKQKKVEGNFVIMQHSSQQWLNPSFALSNKRNDIFISGLAQYLKYSNCKPVHVFLLEYGPDVIHTKKLISDFGIEKFVTWLPITPRKELMLAMENVDLGIGEFGNSWFSYGAIFEYLARGVPIMHYRNDLLYKDLYPIMYPMYHAKDPDSVFKALYSAVESPDKRLAIADESMNWFKEYVVRRPIDLYCEIIESK